jgi:hypothetical protein
MGLVVPYLGRNNWKGKEILLYRDILSTNHLHRAIVCYGYRDETGKYQYLTQVEAEQNEMNVEQVEHQAQANMIHLCESEDSPWVPVETMTGNQAVTVLTKVGSDITASNILRSDILGDLQSYFGTPTVAIGIPNRNTIVACSKPALMLDFFKRKYQESVSKGFEPVSDMIYLAKGGILIGAAPFPGTEEYVDKMVRDVHTVSLKKQGATTSFVKRPTNGLKPAQRKTKPKISFGGKKKINFKSR